MRATASPGISRPPAPISSPTCVPGSSPPISRLRDEASTLPLLETLAGAGVKTALPVTGPRGTPLVFRLWRPGEPTVEGKMGISEPRPAAAEVAPDLLFVPLAAFDRTGHRIGYGAGYYDRTLAALRAKKIFAVGVAYASQETPEFRMKPMTSGSISC